MSVKNLTSRSTLSPENINRAKEIVADRNATPAQLKATVAFLERARAAYQMATGPLSRLYPDILKLHTKAEKRLGTLLLSLGTPMLLAGDEFGNSQNGNNNAYTQDNETTWLDWDWLYSTEQTAELKLFNLTSRLIALRKARDLYNHEDFFTRLSKIGLLKKSDRVHWFLPNGKTPHDADWTNPSVRSFAMQLLSPDEPSLLILVNGSDENVRFHLPNDIEWEMIWSSAEIAGEYPGQGTQIEKLAEFDEEAEDKPAGRFRNHLQRLNTMYWQMDENADSLNSADDGLSEDDPTLWTLPALSISAMKQISTD